MPPENVLPLLLTNGNRAGACWQGSGYCSPEFKDAQAGLLYWGCSSLCPGPFLFPSNAVGLEE